MAQEIEVSDAFKVRGNVNGEALYKVAIVEEKWVHFRNAARPEESLSRMDRNNFLELFEKVP
jgi:hypothetical protein